MDLQRASEIARRGGDVELADDFRTLAEESRFLTDDKTEVATFFGVSPQRIDKWATRGMPYRAPGRGGVRGEYNLQSIASWLAEQRMSVREVNEEQVAAETQYRQEKAVMAELQRKKLEGELVEVAAFRDRMAGVCATIRRGIARFAAQFGPEAMDTLEQIVDAAEAEIDKVVSE